MAETASDLVLDYIERNRLGVGDQLPAEVDMAETLRLSRNSVREAYVDLIAKGLIRRKHGVGTFVADPPILNLLGGTVGFWGLIERSGMEPALDEISRGEDTPPKDIAALLELTPARRVGRLRWLFKANDQPCILIDHYPAPGIPLEVFDAASHNVLPGLAPYIVIEGSQLTTRTTAVNATAEMAGLLDVSEGDALLSGLAVVHSGDGSVALASRSWMVPQLFNSQQAMQLTSLHFSGNSARSREDQTT